MNLRALGPYLHLCPLLVMGLIGLLYVCPWGYLWPKLGNLDVMKAVSPKQQIFMIFGFWVLLVHCTNKSVGQFLFVHRSVICLIWRSGTLRNLYLLDDTCALSEPTGLCLGLCGLLPKLLIQFLNFGSWKMSNRSRTG